MHKLDFRRTQLVAQRGMTTVGKSVWKIYGTTRRHQLHRPFVRSCTNRIFHEHLRTKKPQLLNNLNSVRNITTPTKSEIPPARFTNLLPVYPFAFCGSASASQSGQSVFCGKFA